LRAITAQRVTEAVTAVVDETPTGAAGGTLYAALTAYLGLHQFEAMMRALVAAERISRRGDRYFPDTRDNRSSAPVKARPWLRAPDNAGYRWLGRFAPSGTASRTGF
jgi:hypothetical protein